MKLVIGLVGKPGSGKDTFIGALERALVSIPNAPTMKTMRFSDVLNETLRLWSAAPGRASTFADTLRIWSIAPNAARIRRVRAVFRKFSDYTHTRENLQKLAWVMNRTFGARALARAVQFRAARMEADVVVLNGVRWEADVVLIRKFPKNLIVYVTASQRTRFDRMKNRGEKTGERTKTFAQFLREERAHTEILITKIGADADAKLSNNKSLEAFEDKVRRFAARKLMRTLRNERTA